MTMRVRFVSMPFCQVGVPSLGLAQLQAALREAFRDEPGTMEASVHHLAHDFAAELGAEACERVASSANLMATGVGEWLFAGLAFPGAPDRTEAYLRRHFPVGSHAAFREQLLDWRRRLPSILAQAVEEHGLAEAEVVGFSSMFYQTAASIACAREIRRRNPAVRIVLGGANCRWPMGGVLAREVDVLDHVFAGPALVNFPAYVRNLVEGRPDANEMLAGVLSRANAAPGGSHDGRDPALVTGQERDIDLRLDLDYAPFLDSVERRLAGQGVEPTLLFETSRGCWWGQKSHCIFCGMNGASLSFRAMTPDNARAELASVTRHADRCRRFEAVDNILPRGYARTVFTDYRAPAGALLTYEVRATLDLEELELLVRAGVRECNPGIESLDSDSLRALRKGLTAFRNVRFLADCVQAGMFPFWLLLVGIPGETDATYERYLRMFPSLHHLPPPFFVTPLVFDRYSVCHREPQRFGLDLRPAPFYEHVFPFPPEVLADLACKFRNVNLAAADLWAYTRWYHRLNRSVEAWKARWRGDGEPPRLHACDEGGRRRVYDSRGETPVWHDLDDLAWRILDLLEEPAGRDDLLAVPPLAGEDPARVDEALALLGSRGLALEEGGRSMGLVMPARAARPALDFGRISRNTVRRTKTDFTWDG